MELLGAASVVLLVCVACLLSIAQWRRRSGKGKMPEGPAPFPIVGNILQVKPKNLAKTLEKLSEKYGPVFSVQLGPTPVVVLCGYEVVKEALIDLFIYLFIDCNFSELTGMPFDPTFKLSCAVSNIICSIVFGKRFDYKDKKFLSLMNNMNNVFEMMNSRWGQIYQMFSSILDYLPGPHNNIFKEIDAVKAFAAEETKLHQASLDPSAPQDFIDCFLSKMQKEKDNPKSHFTVKNLVTSTFDLFIA
ncbi:CP2AD protein, partial [Odontophorus gujanensis]|nr:CP2AD protein [Odontophorus gujanensis]